MAHVAYLKFRTPAILTDILSESPSNHSVCRAWLAWIAARPLSSASLELHVELLANMLLIRSLLVVMAKKLKGDPDKLDRTTNFLSYRTAAFQVIEIIEADLRWKKSCTSW